MPTISGRTEERDVIFGAGLASAKVIRQVDGGRVLAKGGQEKIVTRVCPTKGLKVKRVEKAEGKLDCVKGGNKTKVDALDVDRQENDEVKDVYTLV